MTNCRDIEERLVLRPAGAETADVRAHIESCPRCRSAASSHQEVWGALDLIDGRTVSRGFAEGVWKRIDAEGSAGAPPGPRIRRWLPIGMIGTAAAAALLAMVLRPDGREIPDLSYPPEELLANLDFYENLDMLEEHGEAMDLIELSLDSDELVLSDEENAAE